MDDMELDKIVAIVSGSVAIATAIAGGAWGLYRLLKSRTFKPRLSLGVEAHFEPESGNGLLCTIEVRNVGLSKVDIDKAYIICIRQVGNKRIHSSTRKVLRAHSWIEPGATLNEEEFIQFAVHNGVVKVTFRLFASGTAFEAKHVVLTPRVNSHKEHNESTQPTQ